jgi:oligopeptide/dipeptide ABC transporter ATP-binding protein
MYLGRIVEKASVDDIFLKPKHPYTIGLMNSIPSLTTTKEEKLVPIEGVVPDILTAGKGCGFESRCPNKMEQCTRLNPPLTEAAPGHYAACWLHTDEGEGGNRS